MDFINKLSQKEKNLIFMLITIVILVASYRLGFVRLSDLADTLYSENMEMSVKLKDLQEKTADKEKYTEEIARMTEEMDFMLNHLSTSMSQEKSTSLIIDLEKYSKISVNAISFGEAREIFSSSKTGETQGEASAETEKVEKEEKEEKELKGYQSNITINYQANYAGLKAAIDYINQYKEKMRIESLTAAFDNTTGNLTGTLSFDIFALLGEERIAEPVVIGEVKIGTDNIFGTFELPVE